MLKNQNVFAACYQEAPCKWTFQTANYYVPSITVKDDYQIIIVGGGLAGLTAAIHLGIAGISVLLIEKYAYPKHKVCGEYVSNEVLEYLRQLGVDPIAFGAKEISKFQFTGVSGAGLAIDLEMGGFGISRFAFDAILLERAKSCGVSVLKDTVEDIHFSKDLFTVNTSLHTLKASFVVGAFGKRSGLDKTLSRNFIQQKSPWMAVKAHYEGDFSDKLVALHHFKGGYCGLSKVESNHINACYLAHYSAFKKYKDVALFQEEILYQNKALKTFFETSTMVFEKPLTISQISFQKKTPVENHICMIGDSAGLIHPLCGNGMAMAIHSAKILCEVLLAHQAMPEERGLIESAYSKQWKTTFNRRMYTGKLIQNGLQKDNITHWGVSVLQRSPSILKRIIKATHGDPI
ncbi:MAG: flavin-dependent dehydrogenase [Flavobacteriales bacterium]